MHAIRRPYAAAGAALLGAGVIAVNPALPYRAFEQGLQRVSDAGVRLASVSALPDLTLQGLENIPYNFFASFANLPYYEFSAPISVTGPDAIADGQIAYLADAQSVGLAPFSTDVPSMGAVGFLDNLLAYEGNFWVVDAVNVLGIDPADPPKIAALADILTGNPQLGDAISSQLIPIAEAEAPLQAGCVAVSVGGCPDPFEILTGSNQSTGFDPLGTSHVAVPGYFSVPIQDFFSSAGHTFPGSATDPLLNPVPAGEAIPPGYPFGVPTNPIPLGPIPPYVDSPNTYYETLPWSGETVHLDPNGPADAYLSYLTQNPVDNPIMMPDLQNVTTDLNNLATGLFNTFNPFVDGTYCLPCAPFVPGDNDLTNFLTSEYAQLSSNFGTFFNDPAGEIAANFQAFIAHLEASVPGGAAADVSPLFDSSALSGLLDSSALSTGLTGLVDPTALTTELTNALGNSATDLTALLGSGGFEDFANLATSFLPDLATFVPF